MRLVSIALAGAALFAVALFAAPASARSLDWPRFGIDPARSNHYRAPTGIHARDLEKLKRRWVALPGTVDSSPVYLDHVRLRGRKRDVLFGNTSYGRVVAVDAEKAKLLWTYTPPGYDALAGTFQITPAS